MKTKEILIIFVLTCLVTVITAFIPVFLSKRLVMGLPLPFLVEELVSAPCDEYGVCPQVLISVTRWRPLCLVIDFIFWFLALIASWRAMKWIKAKVPVRRFLNLKKE